MTEISREYFSQWVQYRRSFDEFKKMHKTYDTQLIVYDQENLNYTLPVIYCDFNPEYDIILHNIYEMTTTELLSKYYSRRYRRIYIPSDPRISPEISHVVSEVIENAIQSKVRLGKQS